MSQSAKYKTATNNGRKPLEVAYLLQAAYDVEHFGPVCQALLNRGANAYFVLRERPVWFRSSKKRNEKRAHVARLKTLLKERDLPLRKEIGRNADAALTTQAAEGIRNCRNAKIKSCYGAPSYRGDGHCLYEQNEGFDGVIIHGQLQHDLHAKHLPADRVKMIGIPKYDTYFNTKIARAEILAKYDIPDNKPVIAYLPTWDERHSTIHDYHDAFSVLAQDYTLVVRPHPHTEKNNHRTGELDKLRELTPHVLRTSDPTEHAIAVANLLVTDVKSGASTESIYITRGKVPWIGLTQHPDETFFDTIVRAGPIVREPTDLPKTVAEIHREDRFGQARSELILHTYKTNYGNAAEDAADAIEEIAGMDVISRGTAYGWNKMKRSLQRRGQKLKIATGFKRAA